MSGALGIILYRGICIFDSACSETSIVGYDRDTVGLKAVLKMFVSKWNKIHDTDCRGLSYKHLTIVGGKNGIDFGKKSVS